MTQTAEHRGTTMPKIQKSFMVNEDLYQLVEALEHKSGASFTRIVTAALFSYMFRTFQDPREGEFHGADPLWIELVVSVEKGVRTVADLPLDLLDGWIIMRQRWLAELAEEDSTKNKEKIDALAKELKKVRTIRRSWNNSVEDFGKMEACIEAVGKRWFTEVQK